MTYYRQPATGRTLRTRVASSGRIVSTGQFINSTLDRLRPAYQFKASNALTSAGNVTRVPNARGTDSLVVGSGTLAAPAADVLFGGALSIIFTGTQWLDSNLAPGAWKFMHNGSGFEVFHVLAPTFLSGNKAIASTLLAYTAASTGYGSAFAAATSTYLQVSNGTNLLISTLAGTVAVDVATYINQYHGLSQPLNYGMFLREASVAAANSSQPPATGNPDGSLRLGATINGLNQISMRWVETLIFPRVLQEFERQIVREYIQTTYGITAPVVQGLEREVLSMMPFSWPRADLFATSGTKATAFSDKGRPGSLYSQASAPAQVLNPTPQALLGNQLVAAFTGVEDYTSNLPVSSWAFTGDGSGCDIYAVIRATNVSGLKVVYESSSSTSILGVAQFQNAANLNTAVYRNSAPNLIGSTTLGALTANIPNYTRVSYGTARSPQYSFRKNGSAALTGSFLNPAVAGVGTLGMTIGANIPHAFGWVGDWAELLVFSRVLTSWENSIVENYFLSRYGLAS